MSLFLFKIMLHQLNFSGKLMSLERPKVMGILNVTTDSFFDGGSYVTDRAALDRVGQMLDEGADIIDIGAMSTRPGAEELSEEVELSRIRHAVRLIHEAYPNAPISVDTWRASVAKAAVDDGASMINDISGGTFDEALIPLVGAMQVPYCLMHTTAKPDRMQQCTDYEDILADMLKFFGQQLEKLHQASVHDIVIDPGFGFGKTLEQNHFILHNLDAFKVFGLPLLIGISRKSMIYKALGCSPQEALNGTTVINTIAVMQGAHILRVHDVKEAVEVCRLVTFPQGDFK